MRKKLAKKKYTFFLHENNRVIKLCSNLTHNLFLHRKRQVIPIMKNNNKEGETMSSNEKLEQLIKEAIHKINGNKESDLCRFIPALIGDGYLHHFTFRKKKTEEPEELIALITRHVIAPISPKPVPPKRRASRRKKRDQFLFSKDDIDRMLNMARIAGDKEMIRKLTPKVEFSKLKKELLSSIRKDEVDFELYNQYAETLNVKQEPAENRYSMA